MCKRSLLVAAILFLFGVSTPVFAADYPTDYRIAVDQDDHIVQLQGRNDDSGLFTTIDLPSDSLYIQASQFDRGGISYVAVSFESDDSIDLQVYHPNGTTVVDKHVFQLDSGESFGHFRLEVIDTDNGRRIQVRAIRKNPHGFFSRFLHKQYNLKKNQTIERTLSKSAKIQRPSPTGDQTTDARKLFNYYRKKAGLVPAKRDADAIDGCELHVNYMVVNDVLSHSENTNAPGYTDEGNAAGLASDLAQGVPTLGYAMELWVHSLYHRLPILDPSLTHVGYAYDDDGGYACWHLGNRNAREYYFAYPAILFPAPGMTNVPATFNDGESPDPLDAIGGTYPAGEVVTISLNTETTVSRVTFRMQDDDGNRVAGYLRLPNDSSDPNVDEQGNTISFIPEEPLENTTEYTVSATVTSNNGTEDYEWSFTTE